MLAQVRVAFKNVLDKRATYKIVESDFLTLAANEYARLYCKDYEIYRTVMQEKITIKLNGKVVLVDDWSITPLRDGDKVLMTPAIEGDNMGILGMVLGAFLIVAAAFTGGATLSFFGIAFNQTLFLMGAAMILGGLVQMFMTPDLPTFSGALGDKGSTTYSWSGTKTQARPDQPVPIIYGKHKVGGNLINIFTERQGADDYLYMLIALAEGEIAGICTEDNTDNVCTTTDFDNAAYKHPSITISEQPMQNYTDIEWWYRSGTNMPDASVLSTDPSAQNIIPYFTGARMQMDDGRRIDDDGITYTTSKEVDMATIQVRFPNMFTTGGGEIKTATVHYKIEFRKNGTSPWTELVQTKYTPGLTAQAIPNGVTSPLRKWGSNLAWTDDTPGYFPGTNQFSGDTYILSDQKPDSFWFQITRAVVTQPKVVYSGWGDQSLQALKWEYDITIKNLTTGEIWVETIKYEETVIWDDNYGNSYYRPDVKRFVIGNFLLNAPLEVAVGETYILAAAKDPVGEVWRTITNKSKTGFWETNTIDFHTVSGGLGQQIYDIKLTRQEPVSDSFEVSNDMILASVIERINGDFIYPNTALLGFRIKATGQLSGSPPNIITEIKGMKINVPNHSGSERFEEIFWDEDDSRWEYDGAARTWDGTTYTEEYSNNSMLCLKDLMTNKVYGLGEYTNDNDFNDANTTAIIKECHKEYSPTDTDHLLWWSAGNPGEFVKAIEDSMSSQYQNTLTINSSVPSISYTGNYTHIIPAKLDAPLKSNQRYRFSITLSGTSHNVDIELALSTSGSSSWYQIGDYTTPEISNKGNGTHTYDFTAPFTGINNILITIKKNGGPINISGTVTDISLDSIQGNGLNRAWHYHTYNGVLDSKQAALSTLLEFTNSFRVWPSWYEGTFKFIMDKDETPIHTISISNTVSFAQSWVPLSEIPYRIIAQFTDEDQNYDLTQIMIKSTDTNVPKSNEQTIGLKGITNRKRAEREVKFRFSKFVNSTHSINIRCGMDMIHATAGDIINVSNDLPQWGHGSRVASYNTGNKYIYLTEPFTVTNATPLDIMIKYQDVNNDFQTATLNVIGVSDGDILRRVTTKSWPAAPNINGPAVIGLSTSYVKPFRLLSVTRTGEEEVEANALEHNPTLYSSEPTLVINQDYETDELDINIAKPGAPINVKVSQLSAVEGIGWNIGAEHADIRSQEIIVQFSEDGQIYTQIGSILQGQTGFVYSNIHLQTGQTYQFRFMAKGPTGNSSSVYVGAYLEKRIITVAPVTGMQIKGNTPNVQTWDGLDVTVQWNPVGQNIYKSGLMDFYTVRVYSNTYDPDDQQNNLIRTSYPKITEYKYTYDMNLEDSGAEFPYAVLIFVITANLINGIESIPSRPFSVTNVAPSTPQNLTSHPSFRSVGWKWSSDGKTDFKEYKLRSRLESTNATPATTGAWSEWTTQGHNEYTRTVNGTENDIFKWRTRVYFEVKAIDLYNSSSNVVAGNTTNRTFNLKAIDIATFAVTAPKIATFAVTTEKIATFAVTTPKIGDGAVASIKIADAAIEEAKIGNLAVTEAKIQNLAVSSGKIASLAVTNALIASLAVTNGKIQNLAVSSGKIASLAVTNALIASLAVTTGKIQDLAVMNAKILSIEASKIQTNFLSAISANFGTITAGDVSGVLLIGNTIQTAESGRMVKITSEGMVLHETDVVGKYGGDFKYGDGTKYGSGALAYVHHSSQKVPFYISAEQTVADYHLYDRSSEPSGACEVGDLIVDGGKLKICTVAGTGGGATWVIVGTQT